MWADADLGALAANYRQLRSRLRAEVKIIAAIKANAYGHGAIEVARTLAAETRPGGGGRRSDCSPSKRLPRASSAQDSA